MTTRILLTGATGYIGGRLIVELLKHGYRVRVLARNAQRLRNHTWINQVELVEGDANDFDSLHQALKGVSVAYYLLHALLVKGDPSEINVLPFRLLFCTITLIPLLR